MSEFRDQIDSSNSICPYCEASYQVEGEDYSENEQIIECDECGKKYYLSQDFSVDHCTQPDCELNGDKHQYKWRDTKRGGAFFCKVCGKCTIQLQKEG
jgi:hypothetical protein